MKTRRQMLELATRLGLTKLAVTDALQRLGQLHDLIDTPEIATAGAALSDARDALSKLDTRITQQLHEGSYRRK